MRKSKKALFKFSSFTLKQKKVLTWWVPEVSPVADMDGIIADGSVRSGKTLLMSLSFVLWAMTTFEFETFGMAGKTIASFRRNVLFKLKLMLWSRGYSIKDKRSENLMIISKNGVENYFYIFGGKDEASQDLVQGLTCAGFFFDEVALMPESFVNQAVARCSVEGSKLWFNCNPGGPFHWFKVEWIDKQQEKNMFRIQFRLDDNPSLGAKVRARYERMFTGVFYERYILGLWVMAEGVIYSMFNRNMAITHVPKGVKIVRKWIGIDYGQSNATVFVLVGLGDDGKVYILNEYYHSGRDAQVQKSPSRYAKDFKEWLKACGTDGMPVQYERIFIDPSAKGFILQLYEEGVTGIREADNDVSKGIQLISSIIQSDAFRVITKCKHVVMELGAYSWDPKAQDRGEDVPLKKHDHLMDAIRYVFNGNRLIFQRLITKRDAV